MLLALALALAVPVAEEQPLVGDVLHGQKLLEKAGAEARVDGAWLNAVSDDEAVALIRSGKRDFPRVTSDNILDRWDVLAALKAKNTDLQDLLMGADTVLVSDEKLDENAQKRLTDQARIASSALADLRVFTLFKMGHKGLAFVSARNAKERDKLKPDKKVGYVVFTKLPGFKGGNYEVALAVDPDIHIQEALVRAPDGSSPQALNQAAARFHGKGARGQYAALKAGGAGKAIREIERPLSEAFLIGVENVYMYEVQERDYFAF